MLGVREVNMMTFKDVEIIKNKADGIRTPTNCM